MSFFFNSSAQRIMVKATQKSDLPSPTIFSLIVHLNHHFVVQYVFTSVSCDVIDIIIMYGTAIDDYVKDGRPEVV